jgi:hypothetical protein
VHRAAVTLAFYDYGRALCLKYSRNLAAFSEWSHPASDDFTCKSGAQFCAKSSRRFDVIGALVEFFKLSGNSVSIIIAFGTREKPSLLIVILLLAASPSHFHVFVC